MARKHGGHCTRMLRAVLNKSWRQHSVKQKLYEHLPPISKTIQIRWARYVGHCWRSKGELISDALLWTPSHGRTRAGKPARTYLQQLCTGRGCSLEDLPQAMNDRDGWQERVREIRASSMLWWSWWYHQVMLTTLISLTLSCQPSLPSIAPSSSSKLHPVSPQRWCE